jgi:hypothetical protein
MFKLFYPCLFQVGLFCALPVVCLSKPRPLPPSLVPSQFPSAFTSQWGDYFLSSSVFSYDDYDSLDVITDGGVNIGVGFGDARKFISFEVDYNLESLRGLSNGGSFDIRVSRVLIAENNLYLAVGGGWLSGISYGQIRDQEDTAYVALSAAVPLYPDRDSFRQVFQLNLGAANGRLKGIFLNPDDFDNGLFLSAGIELSPSVGTSLGWSSRGFNAGISVIPLPEQPISLTLSGINLANVDKAGRAVAFTVTWGDNFKTPRFNGF